jgi:hypothetical protein
VIRFTAGDFTSDIEFDEAGFVTSYPGIGRQVTTDPMIGNEP